MNDILHSMGIVTEAPPPTLAAFTPAHGVGRSQGVGAAAQVPGSRVTFPSFTDAVNSNALRDVRDALNGQQGALNERMAKARAMTASAPTAVVEGFPAARHLASFEREFPSASFDAAGFRKLQKDVEDRRSGSAYEQLARFSHQTSLNIRGLSDRIGRFIADMEKVGATAGAVDLGVAANEPGSRVTFPSFDDSTKNNALRGVRDTLSGQANEAAQNLESARVDVARKPTAQSVQWYNHFREKFPANQYDPNAFRELQKRVEDRKEAAAYVTLGRASHEWSRKSRAYNDELQTFRRNVAGNRVTTSPPGAPPPAPAPPGAQLPRISAAAAAKIGAEIEERATGFGSVELRVVTVDPTGPAARAKTSDGSAAPLKPGNPVFSWFVGEPLPGTEVVSLVAPGAAALLSEKIESTAAGAVVGLGVTQRGVQRAVFFTLRSERGAPPGAPSAPAPPDPMSEGERRRRADLAARIHLVRELQRVEARAAATEPLLRQAGQTQQSPAGVIFQRAVGRLRSVRRELAAGGLGASGWGVGAGLTAPGVPDLKGLRERLLGQVPGLPTSTSAPGAPPPAETPMAPDDPAEAPAARMMGEVGTADVEVTEAARLAGVRQVPAEPGARPFPVLPWVIGGAVVLGLGVFAFAPKRRRSR